MPLIFVFNTKNCMYKYFFVCTYIFKYVHIFLSLILQQVSIVEGTMLTPAMIVVAMQKCATATATGQNASVKGRVQMSITVCMGIYCLCVKTFPIIFRQRWRVESMGPLGQLQ